MTRHLPVLLILLFAGVFVAKRVATRTPAPGPAAAPAPPVEAAESPAPQTAAPQVQQQGASDVAQSSRVERPAETRASVGPDTSVVAMSANEVPGQLVRYVNRPTVTVLYATTCSNSKRMMPGIARLARDYGGGVADFAAISTDDAEDAYYVREFLRMNGAPFSPLWVRPWVPGTLSEAIRSTGINVGSTFTLPMIIVRDSKGQLVSVSQGMADLSALEGYLRGRS